MIGRPRSSPPAPFGVWARHLARRFVGRWVLVGLIAEAALAGLDAGLPHSSIITTGYLVPVLALALVETGERTTVLAIVAIVLTLVSGWWNHDATASEHLYRLAIVAGGGALGALGAMFRSRAVVGRDRMEMLAAISELADGTGEIDDALRRLADVLVPRAADACGLAVFEGADARRVATRGATPRLQRVLADLPPPSPQAVRTAKGGEAMLVRRFAGVMGREAVRVSDEALEIMRRTDIFHAIYAPVRAVDQTLALLVIGVGPSGRRYGPDDVRFARTVGSRAALALQNARLLEDLRQARQRIETIVGSLADAVTIRDRSGRLVYANAAAKESMDLGPSNDISTEDPVDLFNRFHVTDEQGRPMEMSALPSVRLLAGEDPEPLTLRFVNQANGEGRWRVLKSTPLYDAHGHLEAAVTIIEDITETKLAELRSRFLSRVSEILSSSLDYEQTLRNVAELAVPELADWCAVDLVDERGTRQQVVAAHRDPAKLALAQRLRELDTQPLDPSRGLGAVLRTGASEFYAQIDDALLQRAAADSEQLRLLRAVGMRSAVIVPMRGAGGIVGAMTLVNAESGRSFTEADIDFAEHIAARAAVAVENARVYSERARIAATLQRSLLPEALPEIHGWSVASLYQPASSEGAVEVGGDFYDAFAVGGGALVLIGDVTGKGVEAAAMTSLVRHGARFVSEYVPEPAEILARLDRSLRQQSVLSLCTALCLRVEGERVVLASAGHPLPLVVSEAGVRSVGRPGSVLGAFPDGNWPTQEIVLSPSEVLVLYTDGITDTVGENGRFGEERLRETLACCKTLVPDELLHELELALARFEAGRQADDRAALALRLVAWPEVPVAAGRRVRAGH